MKGIFGQLEKLINEHGSAQILRERLGLAADQYAALEKKATNLEAENQSLRQQVESLRKESTNLKQKMQNQADRPPDFTDDTHKVLRYFFDQPGDHHVQELSRRVSLDRPMTEYHFDLLFGAGFIIQSVIGMGDSPPMCTITPEGRKYVVRTGI